MYWLISAAVSLNKHLTGQLNRHAAEIQLNRRESGPPFSGEQGGASISHHSIRLPVGDGWDRLDRRSLPQQITAQQLHSWIRVGIWHKGRKYSEYIFLRFSISAPTFKWS